MILMVLFLILFLYNYFINNIYVFIYKIGYNCKMFFYNIYVDIPNIITCIKLYHELNIIIQKSLKMS